MLLAPEPFESASDSLRSAEAVLAPLMRRGSNPQFRSSPLIDAQTGLSLPRFIFHGETGGGETVNIGIFAGIHGDEPAGVLSLCQLVADLLDDPEFGRGYRIYLYPICNPHGFERHTRHSRHDVDLNREFWKNSSEYEVQLLERELATIPFHGLISLHSDDSSPGMYGFVRGAVLARCLLEPALYQAAHLIPRDVRPVIDGFPADRGIISECYEGILTTRSRGGQQPFEIILETPGLAPEGQQVAAGLVAVSTILREYQKLLSFAADL